MNPKPSFSAILMVLFALVFGCTESETTFKDGGDPAPSAGSNPGSGGTPEPRSGPVAPLKVTATTPESDARNIDRTAAVSAQFDREVLGTSITSSSLTLSAGGQAISGIASFDPESNLLSFSPDSRLPKSASVEATIDKSVADLSGTSLSDDYRWSFVTAGPSWDSPVSLEDDSDTVAGHHLAMNASGNAVAIWAQDQDVYVSRFDAVSGNWGDRERLSKDAGNNSRPHVAIDRRGNIMAVWSKGGRERIYASRFDASRGSWDKETRIGDNNGDEQYPRVAMDAQGNAMAVWQRRGDLANNVYARRFIAGSGEWGDPERLESILDDSTRPQVAMDSAGNAVVVWRQRVGFFSIFNTTTVYANRFVVSAGQWLGATAVGASVNSAANPELAMDSSGRAFVVWRQSDGGNQNIYASRSDNSGRWTGAEIIGSAGTSSIQPDVATDGQGNAYAVWRSFAGGAYTIQVNRFSGGWGVATPILSNGERADYPMVSTDASGNALVAWVQRAGGAYFVDTRFFDRGGSAWSDPERISGGSSSPYEPSVGMDSDGDALVAWLQGSGNRNDLYSNRYY